MAGWGVDRRGFWFPGACVAQVDFKFRRTWSTSHPVYFADGGVVDVMRDLNFMDIVHETITTSA